MEEIRFKTSDFKQHNYSKQSRVLLKLNRIPILRNVGFVKRIVYKILNIDDSTILGKKFYCSTANLTVGKNVGLSDTFILAYAPVTIGNNCSFSYRNMLITSTHDINDFSVAIAKPIVIEDNVWITTNVTVLGGVTIGHNTIIGAGSVVTCDIPSGVFATGNPCRVIREIKFNK